MSEIGIRALKQNASAVVAEAAAGHTVTITDRGRPVAQMSALPHSALQRLLDSGRARLPRVRFSELPAPAPAMSAGSAISEELQAMREAERY
ncbi:type II toxin-antitoxin system Phd/YefM family antitoxin [Brachybacterium muris]|uniref:type II toxin-antitoxin system Phd/YefM family antitoxin n=1 Tax=Brachybacterium muris TaxID=219301 RepID=UPI00223B73F0|nr:type II toxin-antitoxin system prevent-host-death family antitoxin [Brachybacterium muris]MCT1653283.1 type II toxin-antitoxin system prevent-host-death family antitoxin [Brachybacterium muris]